LARETRNEQRDQRYKGGRAYSKEAPSQEVHGRDPNGRHDQTVGSERPRVASGQPQEWLHSCELTNEGSGMRKEIDRTRAIQAIGRSHVDPVVVVGESYRAGGGGKEEGDRDPDADEDHKRRDILDAGAP
jgi:hypothetical protein